MPNEPVVRIGLFGGTFDPPHLGHLILANEAYAQLNLNHLLWTVTPNPPHKQDQVITRLKHRLAMVKLAIEDDPRFELSRVELDRPGMHYTVDTVKTVRDENPNTEIVPIMGGDSLRDLPKWRDPKELLDVAHWVGVMRRPSEVISLKTLEETLPGITSKVRFVDAPLLEIASREIRNRIADRLPYRYYLPAAVYEYIERHRLYLDPYPSEQTQYTNQWS